MCTETTKYESPFSREQLLEAKVGQKLVDTKGSSWSIVSKARETPQGDVEITVSYEGGYSEVLVLIDGQLLEKEEWAIIIELNRPNAKIV